MNGNWSLCDMFSFQNAPKVSSSYKSSDNIKFPDVLERLWGPTGDSTGPNIEKVLIIACDIFFCVSSLGWQSCAERCFQPLHHNLPVIKPILLWRYSPSQGKCAAVTVKVAEIFRWLHLSPELLFNFCHLNLFLFFLSLLLLSLDRASFSAVHLDGDALILS